MSEDFDLPMALESALQTGQCKAACDDPLESHLTSGRLCDGKSRLTSEILYEGVELEVTCPSPNMRSIANLIISLNRLKSMVSTSSTNFLDEQLSNNLFDPLVEGGVVAVHDHTLCRSANDEFHLLGKQQCTLSDISQKTLVKPEDAMVLQAITLRGNHNSVKKAIFSLGQYISNQDTPEAPPVALSIAGSKWHISCSMTSEKAVLQLEEVSCGLDCIQGDGEMTRFLFYKRDSGNGMSLTTFESAKYRGWFIRTSSVDNEAVSMCHATSLKMTSFNINF